MKKLMRNKKGFSLIELIIVIAILAVIAAIAVPNLLDNINKSRIQTDVSNAKLIANSVAQIIAEDEDHAATIKSEGLAISEFTSTASSGSIIADAAAALQPVPVIKYKAGYADGTNANGHFYVVVSDAGVITVYGANAVSDTHKLFPDVPSNSNWHPDNL